jgi:hypothetical protein
MFCPKCGKETQENQAFCASCGAPLQKLGTTNTSGMGPLAQIPPEIRGWNWGAFFLGWIWGLGNSVWIALLEWVPYVGIVMIFVLGAKGNEWAWANKKWGSVEDFKRTQRSWALWGLGIWIAVAAIVVLIIALAVLTSD